MNSQESPQLKKEDEMLFSKLTEEMTVDGLDAKLKEMTAHKEQLQDDRHQASLKYCRYSDELTRKGDAVKEYERKHLDELRSVVSVFDRKIADLVSDCDFLVSMRPIMLLGDAGLADRKIQ